MTRSMHGSLVGQMSPVSVVTSVAELLSSLASVTSLSGSASTSSWSGVTAPALTWMTIVMMVDWPGSRSPVQSMGLESGDADTGLQANPCDAVADTRSSWLLIPSRLARTSAFCTSTEPVLLTTAVYVSVSPCGTGSGASDSDATTRS